MDAFRVLIPLNVMAPDARTAAQTAIALIRDGVSPPCEVDLFDGRGVRRLGTFDSAPIANPSSDPTADPTAPPG